MTCSARTLTRFGRLPSLARWWPSSWRRPEPGPFRWRSPTGSAAYGDADGALAVLHTGSVLNPNDTEVMAELGRCYALLGQGEKARPLLEESFVRNPFQPNVYRIGLFLVEYAAGNFKAALTEARKLCAPDTVYPFVAIAAAAGHRRQAGSPACRPEGPRADEPDYRAHLVADLEDRNLDPDLLRSILDGLRKAEQLAGTGGAAGRRRRSLSAPTESGGLSGRTQSAEISAGSLDDDRDPRPFLRLRRVRWRLDGAAHGRGPSDREHQVRPQGIAFGEGGVVEVA